MTVIYVMFLVLFIISLVLVLDQLHGKNLKKQSYLSKKSRIEENEHFIVARWLPSCHDGSCLLAKKIEEINLKNICSSHHDGTHRSTMTLLGDQADEMHKISYNFELYLPIVLQWTYRSTMAC